MNSRYDFMIDGSVKDEITGSYYPDPLSLNYHRLRLPKNLHVEKNLSDDDIMFLWERVSRYYGAPEWDDIVLMVNNVPHINLLENGESLLFPSEESILGAYSKETSV